MRYCITHDGVVINGKFEKQVSVSKLSPEIHAVNFDSETNQGTIEYRQGVTRSVQVRDFPAEDAAYRAAIKNNKKLDQLQPIYTTKQVQREPREISSEEFERILKQLTDA